MSWKLMRKVFNFSVCLSGHRVESPVQVPGLLAGLGQGGPGQLHLEPRHGGAEGPGPRVQDVSRPQVLREKERSRLNCILNILPVH